MTESTNTISFSCPVSIVLVGMMGAGKTSVGKRLAPKLGLPFFDSDKEIEKASGMSVSDLFATRGEEEFRIGEARVIDRLLTGDPMVLATGGGAVTTKAVRDSLAERAVSVWLHAPIGILVSRATKRDTRPLLRTGDPQATMARLLRDREPYYSAADLRIDTSEGSRTATIEKIIAELIDHPKVRRTSSKAPA